MGIGVRGLIVLFPSSSRSVNNNNLKDLGQRIRARRKALGMTQEEMADTAGIDRSYIGGVERGERNITFNVLCQICLALQCDVSTLTVGLPTPKK